MDTRKRMIKTIKGVLLKSTVSAQVGKYLFIVNYKN